MTPKALPVLESKWASRRRRRSARRRPSSGHSRRPMYCSGCPVADSRGLRAPDDRGASRWRPDRLSTATAVVADEVKGGTCDGGLGTPDRPARAPGRPRSDQSASAWSGCCAGGEASMNWSMASSCASAWRRLSRRRLWRLRAAGRWLPPATGPTIAAASRIPKQDLQDRYSNACWAKILPWRMARISQRKGRPIPAFRLAFAGRSFGPHRVIQVECLSSAAAATAAAWPVELAPFCSR